MVIRKKSKEELQNQAGGFLEYLGKNKVYGRKTIDEVSEVLGLKESEKRGFFEWLSKKFGKELDIGDESEIKEVLKKKKIAIKTEKIWNEYTKYLKVEKFFEPYKNINPELNDEIIDYIMGLEKLDSKILKNFLLSKVYRECSKHEFKSYVLDYILDELGKNLNLKDIVVLLNASTFGDIANFACFYNLNNIKVYLLALEIPRIFNDWDSKGILGDIRIINIDDEKFNKIKTNIEICGKNLFCLNYINSFYDLYTKNLGEIINSKKKAILDSENFNLRIESLSQEQREYLRKIFDGNTFDLSDKERLKELFKLPEIKRDPTIIDRLRFHNETSSRYGPIPGVLMPPRELFSLGTSDPMTYFLHEEWIEGLTGMHEYSLSEEQKEYLESIFDGYTFDLSDENEKKLFQLFPPKKYVQKADIITRLENFNIISTEIPGISSEAFQECWIYIKDVIDSEVLLNYIKGLKELGFNREDELISMLNYGSNHYYHSDGNCYLNDVLEITKMYMGTLGVSPTELLDICKTLFCHSEYKYKLEGMFNVYNSGDVSLYKNVDNVVSLKGLGLSNKAVIACQFTPIKIFETLKELGMSIDEVNQIFVDDPCYYDRSENKKLELFIEASLITNEGYRQQSVEQKVDFCSNRIEYLKGLLPVEKRDYIIPLLKIIGDDIDVHIDNPTGSIENDTQKIFKSVDDITNKIDMVDFIQFLRSCNFCHRIIVKNLKNLGIVVNRMDALNGENLILLKDIITGDSVDPENLEIIFDKNPEITVDELNSMKHILVNAKLKNLEIVFREYPEITVDELNSIEQILTDAKPENLEIIIRKYPEITIDELNSMKQVLKVKPKNLGIVIGKYPEITVDELNSIEQILTNAIPENLEIIIRKYPEMMVKDLGSLDEGILYEVKYPKIFKLVFEQYPEITIKELISLKDVLVGMRMANWIEIYKRYENIDIKTLRQLKEILSEHTSLDGLLIVLKHYPNITLQELISFADILKTGSKSVAEIGNFGSVIPTSESLALLDLFNDYTNKHDKIFENMEDREKINDKNWINIVGLYSAIEYFEDDKTISDGIKSTIRPLFQSKENKNFIYGKLIELLKKSLSDDEDLTNEEIALLAVLNKKGLLNMGQSESLAKFIYWINKLDKNYNFMIAFRETKGEIMKFVNSHEKDLNELMTLFYQISASLLEKSPAIYRNLIKLLNKLDSKQQEMFCRKIFPLYNVELFLGEKEGKDKLLGKNINNDVKLQLIPMHERIKYLLNKIDEGKNSEIDSLLESESGQLKSNVQQLFAQKFGIKKFPLEFSKENIESVRWHSTYLSNMHEIDEKKTCVLGYFLALKLDGKWSEFREGKYFDPAEYMDTSKVWIINDYLSRRSERKDITKLYDVDESDMKVLQGNESSVIIGNTSGIVERLKTIESNVASLLDDDVYTGRQKIIKSYVDKGLGKNLGGLLSKQFRILLGQNIPLNDEEKKMFSALIDDLGSDIMNNKERIGELQIEYKGISRVVNFVNEIMENDIQKEVNDFVDCCIPSEENLRLFNKIGIHLEDDKIVSSNAFLSFIEGKIETAKKEDKLLEEEYKGLSEYITRVHKELDDLYAIKDKLIILYEELKKSVFDKYFEGTELRHRFEEMSPNFFTKADVERENIVSLMTNDMDIIIKNIRQCLGCTHNGCNNDTDLSFGCNDRFFITTSHREGDTSFADELVTLLPRVPKEEGFTFVMDKIYGDSGSTDVLLNNIYVILKKINKLSPELKKQLSIFVSEGANLKLNEELIGKIQKQYSGVGITKQNITVTIEPQPITDSYHEFGGIDCRSTGAAKISGYLIKFE